MESKQAKKVQKESAKKTNPFDFILGGGNVISNAPESEVDRYAGIENVVSQSYLDFDVLD